ncbi:MAG: class I SAM-dependent methyltransferase [Bacteroidales bacterium]
MKRFPFEKAHLLDSKERYKYQPPDRLINLLKEYKTVLDYGAGTGYFSIPLAKIFKEKTQKSTIIAIDIDPQFIQAIEKKVLQHKVSDIVKTRLTKESITQLPFPDNYFDAVIIINTVHLISDIDSTLKEIYRVLQSKGILIITDWDPKMILQVGPKQDERLPTEQVEDHLRNSKFNNYNKINLYKGFYSYIIRKNDDNYILP